MFAKYELSEEEITFIDIMINGVRWGYMSERHITPESDIPVADIYRYTAEYARLAYEDELRRQDSIMQQASHMQTAFSFITAALFMVATLLVGNCKLISNWFYLVAFSSITGVLLFSLVAATMAQNRKKRKTFENLKKFIDKVENNYKMLISEEQRQKHLATTYAEIEEDLCKKDNISVIWIKISMYSFYFSIILIVGFFVAALKII